MNDAKVTNMFSRRAAFSHRAALKYGLNDVSENAALCGNIFVTFAPFILSVT